MDRSSEERSRLEKWPLEGFEGWFRKEFPGEGPFSAKKEAAMMAWQARAALEDRQEAAPKFDDTEACQHRSCSGTICAGPRSEHGPFSERAHAFVPRKPRSEESAISGVPSEATPSKETQEFPTARQQTFAAGGIPLNTAAKRKSMMRRDENIGHLETVDSVPPEELERLRRKYAVPAPEVQGTPTKECICPTETWTVDGSDMHDSMCEINHDSPVGTPQKETPPMTDFAKVRVAQYEARIPCGNCGHVHLGRCSVCDPPGCEQIVPPTAPVPEGVQGKEPQTPEFTCEECDSNCCITAGGSKLVCYHCYLAKAAPLPEGVQGKEPQTPEPWEIEAQAWLKDNSGRIDRNLKSAFYAGRRSAITEFEKWAEGKYEIDARDVADWCAEFRHPCTYPGNN